jgi:hypothetical protein
MRFPHPTYAGVTATLALFIALGGSSYAALSISGSDVRNGTLTSADVKNGALTGTDVKGGSLTGSDIKNASLGAADFKAGELPAGPAGPAGPTGPTGAPGVKGDPGATNIVTRREDFTVANGGGTATGTAECLPGERAVGGGAGLNGPLNGNAAIYYDEPHEEDGSLAEDGDVPTSWHAGAANSGPQDRVMQVFVLCAAP